MQEVQATLAAGALVEARGRTWQVVELREGARADVASVRGPRLLHLAAVEPPPSARALIDPVDRIRPTTDVPLRYVGRRRWLRALQRALLWSTPADVPAAVADTPALLLPYQLEPLLALRSGLAARVLVADDVGLGKTVQAALIARDLRERQPSAAILVVVPAGLREQWQTELRERAGIEAVLVDADRLRALAAGLPVGATPWSLLPVAIVSLDFVKRTEVRHGLRTRRWDLLIVDEAHLLTAGTDRHAALDEIASRSLRVVMLTATPHDGRDEQFAALCDLGRIADPDPLAIFRRTAADGILPAARTPRRMQTLHVTPDAAEQRVQDLLARYVRRVWTQSPDERTAARLAMTVLARRAASSPWALARSVARRQQLLAAREASPDQLHFDFGGDDTDEEPAQVLAAPGLPGNAERAWLNLLHQAALTASRSESKLQAVSRLLRRTREPVLVFTEYRDTLQRLADHLQRLCPLSVLHGGLTDEARRESVRAFVSGDVRVLLATDAASQGLNLHARCRLVVHVEVPWSPLRLDQRVGRVDRLGQTRRVHSIVLVARGSMEEDVARRLADRCQRIRAAFSAAAMPDGDAADELALLGAALGLGTRDGPFSAPSGTAAARASATVSAGRTRHVIRPALAGAATAAAAELARRRLLLRKGVIRSVRELAVWRVRHRDAHRLALPPGLTCLVLVRIAGNVLFSERTLLALHVPRDLEELVRRGRASHACDRRVTPIDRDALTTVVKQALAQRLDVRIRSLAVSDTVRQPHLVARAMAIERREEAARGAEQLALFGAPVPSQSRRHREAPPIDTRLTASVDIGLVLDVKRA
ncbi:MAG TPA: DEAD/DEAH box helicase [Vicinamibacterales bacterium]